MKEMDKEIEGELSNERFYPREGEETSVGAPGAFNNFWGEKMINNDIVQSVLDRKPADFKDNVEAILSSKLLDAIDDKRREVTSGIMKDMEQTHKDLDD